MTADSRPPRVRIAPSPTGTPHVGTAYIALFNRALARRHGGQFILRIEDTDQERSNPVYEQHIIDALKWLGLDWDEGPDVGGPHAPYRQSERTELYQQHAQMLIDNGTAYRCFCTKERLDELREKQKEQQKAGEKVRLGYDKHCLSLSQKDIDKHLKDKVPFVVRLDIPDSGDTTFGDLLRGEIRHANAELDDKVLLKSDGFPTYHLANVVDDHAMEITHVIRAEEWISSTPLHRLLYKA
ncbi:MAG: glutamate--tRNA ligase, partial [Planctomycetota bacterium]